MHNDQDSRFEEFVGWAIALLSLVLSVASIVWVFS
jgi:hypothetical protein